MNLLCPTMNSESKKRNQLKKDIVGKVQTAKIETIEKIAKILKSPNEWKIVEKITTLPAGKNIETQKFILCFEYLNWNQCHFTQFDQAKGKKLVEILEKVTKCEINKFPELKLVRDSVKRMVPYDSLFINLTPDVTELKETELCGGRVFFYITEPKFNIVSIETKHR